MASLHTTAGMATTLLLLLLSVVTLCAASTAINNGAADEPLPFALPYYRNEATHARFHKRPGSSQRRLAEAHAAEPQLHSQEWHSHAHGERVLKAQQARVTLDAVQVTRVSVLFNNHESRVAALRAIREAHAADAEQQQAEAFRVHVASEHARTASDPRMLAGVENKMHPLTVYASSAALRHLRDAEGVLGIERDVKVKAVPTMVSTPAYIEVSPAPSWGLDRMDGTLNGNYNLHVDHDGTNTRVYVIDTGVNVGHVEFRCKKIYALPARYPGSGNDPQLSFVDIDDHGSHVAGTAVGIAHGIAPDAELAAVRVFEDPEGAWVSDMADSILDVVADDVEITYTASDGSTKTKRKIINMSLSGSRFPASYMVNAFAAAEANGVVVVVAAGNEGEDACENSYGETNSVVAVGAVQYWTTGWDEYTDFSNFGRCVSIAAPGASIKSAAPSAGINAYQYWAGTSMASPHVAGWFARYLEQFPDATAAEARQAMRCASRRRALWRSTHETGKTLSFLRQMTTRTVPWYGSWKLAMKDLDTMCARRASGCFHGGVTCSSHEHCCSGICTGAVDDVVDEGTPRSGVCEAVTTTSR